MSASTLVSGSTYSITNQNTGTEMFYDSITNQVLGYLGMQVNTAWLASLVNDNSSWIFSTASGVFMGYNGTFDGSPIIGVPVANLTLPNKNTQFDVWKASDSEPDDGTLSLTINIHNTLLSLQLSIPDPVPGIPVIMSTENSNLQMWDFELIAPLPPDS